MIVFEYTRRLEILPTSLINHAPEIWTWTNPYMGISSWMYELYGIEDMTDLSKRQVFTSARVDYNMLSTVYSYEDCVATSNSFYWDNTEQVAYFHLEQHPQTYTSMDLSALYGSAYGTPVVFNGILYPNTLLTKPTIERSVEPVVYQKMATQSLGIELVNDELYGIDQVTHKPFKYFRFDDTTDLNGQSTYVKYGEDGETDYSKLKVLHKGIITKITKSGTRLNVTCDDIRSKRDSEWPTTTYEDIGYTELQVGEDLLTTVIPDGFGYNEKMPIECVNRDVAILEVDDDDNVTLPENINGWDMTTWSSANATVTKRTDEAIAKLPTFRVAKTASSQYTRKLFTATATKLCIHGYMRCDVANTPIGTSLIAIKTSGEVYVEEIWINFALKTFSGTTNHVRGKFITNDDGTVLAYYSYEFDAVVGNQYYVIANVDFGAASTNTAVVMTAPIINTPHYPTFRVAKELSSEDDLKVFYEKDEEYIEVTNIASVDLPNGTVSLYDVDAHEDGLVSNGLSTLYCSAYLRAETNPFDIIRVLNDEVADTPYISSFYDMAKCELEKTLLANVSMYKNATTKLTAIIEELQSGSTVGFRYDDIDKIFITCDNPNREVARVIQSEEIIDRESITLDSDLTLYADEVTINYGVDRKDTDPIKERNTDYKEDVLLRYNYTNPLTYESLLTNKIDARNKSIVMLEDLSVVRDTTSIRLHGLGLLDTVALYDIVRVNLKLSNDREFAGWCRMQVIGINIDTDFEIVTLTIRQRDYSSVFNDITGIYTDALVIGHAEEPALVIGDVNEPVEIIGHMES